MIFAIEGDTRLVETRDESIDIEPTPSVFRSFVEVLVCVREAPEKDDFACLDGRDNENDKSARNGRHIGPMKDKEKRNNELSVSLSIAEIIASRNDERVE